MWTSGPHVSDWTCGYKYVEVDVWFICEVWTCRHVNMWAFAGVDVCACGPQVGLGLWTVGQVDIWLFGCVAMYTC